jgi:tetratricopeptide (TPR) repeat protein
MTIVGEDPTATLPPFERELQLLVQLALVQQPYNKEKEPCYCLHPLFRQYVLEHYLEGSSSQPNGLPATSLGVTGSLLIQPISGFDAREAQKVAVAAGYMRVTKYYQQLAQEHYLPPKKRGNPQDIEFLLATIRHLCLGWHWQEACDLVLSEGIYESMVQWGAWNTLIGLYQGMLPPNGALTRHDEGLICNHLGLLYDLLGNVQQSWAFYERALALQRQIGDLHGMALTLTNEGELFRNQREWQHAYANFEQARELNQQLRDPLLESVLLHNQGLLYHAAKDYPQTLSYYQGMILTNIGVLFYEQGFYPEALAVLFYTLQMRQSLQHSTVSFIESFIATLEDNMEINAFARLRQASREVEEQVISRLMPANMRQ